MATTTTNFGWDIPQSTDLVKDGATAIAALGQDIDTAFIDLKGGTTGQILSKASNTDLDYTWVSANPGDITGVTAGTGISGGGTSGDVTITNSMATAIDAKGDLIAGTGADAFSRLAVGTNGQILQADSTAATGLKWATPASGGGMTLLATHSLSGTTSTITGISTAYNRLVCYVYGVTNTSTTADLYVQPNSQTSLADAIYTNAGTTWAKDTNAQVPIATGPSGAGLVYNNSDNAFTLIFDNYSSTTAQKSWITFGGGSDSAGKRGYLNSGIFRSTSAIDGLAFRQSGYTFNGGTVLVYGVK